MSVRHPSALSAAIRAAARARRAILPVATLLAGWLVPAPLHAQPYARFAVDDSALVAALRGSGSQFESAWNALLVTELRASLARADSAGRLLALARRVAAAEPAALGTRIAADALTRRDRWSVAQRRLRVAAAVDESLGAVARRGRDYLRADSLYGAALLAYDRLGERRRIALTLATLGGVAMNRSDWVAVDSLNRRALAAARPLGDPRLMGVALNMLGTAAYQRRRLDDAWEYYQGARAAREQSGERAALAGTLGYLGNVAAAQGRPDTAAIYYRAGLSLAVAAGDSARTQEVLNNYATLLAHGRDPAAAFPVYDRALAIRRQMGDRVGQAEVLLNVGDLLRQQGHYAEALERLAEAQAMARDAGDARTLRMSQLNAGRAELAVGDVERARAALERSLAIADSTGDLAAQAQALNDLSIAARQAGDAAGATRLAQRSLAAASAAGDSAVVRDASTTLGELAFDRQAFADAEQWFGRAASAGARKVDARSGDLQNLAAVAARRERLDDADRLYRQALAMADSSGSPDASWPALLGLGDVAERRGDHARALAFGRDAATMIEALRARQGSERPSVRLLSRRHFAFEALIDLLVRLQPAHPDSAFLAEAFLWSERARARALLDLVAASGQESQATQVRPMTLADVQGRLDERTALMAFSVGDSSTSLWVLKRDRWTHHRLPARAALRAPVEMLRLGLADPAGAEAAATRQAARTLHRLLLEPAMPMLKGVQRLIVVPDGPLASMPFEALLSRDDERDRRPARGAYLVERHVVSYAPSATMLFARPGGSGGEGIVAVGDPAFGVDSVAAGVAVPELPRLPHSAEEIAALRAQAGSRAFVALTGREATRERWLALPELPRAALLHVATHGEANPIEPERSGFWMAASDGAGPGFVSVSDILDLSLRAGLVTLSACETGLGRVERGEGVVGLSRAFLAVGARSVLVSLWKVNDRSTTRLMEAFYRPLLEAGATRAEALARAKRALLDDRATASPFHWAPFILVGDPGTIGR